MTGNVIIGHGSEGAINASGLKGGGKGARESQAGKSGRGKKISGTRLEGDQDRHTDRQKIKKRKYLYIEEALTREYG